MFEQHIKNFQRVEQNMNALIMDVVFMNTRTILDMNRDQLRQGFRSTGTPIKPDYHPQYEDFKKFLGLQWRYPDLYFTGAYYKGFRITFSPDNEFFQIENEDPKSDQLKRKYGRTIEGLSDDHIQDTINLIQPELLRKVRNILL